MSEIVIIQKGSYKFEAKQCESCKRFKKLNKFRYIKYSNAYRKICIQCEKKKREKIKKEKLSLRKNMECQKGFTKMQKCVLQLKQITRQRI